MEHGAKSYGRIKGGRNNSYLQLIYSLVENDGAYIKKINSNKN